MNIPCSSCSLRQGRCCRPTRRSPARCGPPGWVSAGCSTGQLWGRSTPPTLHLDGRNLCEKGRKHLKAMSGHRCVSVEMLVLWITVVQLFCSGISLSGGNWRLADHWINSVCSPDLSFRACQLSCFVCGEFPRYWSINIDIIWSLLYYKPRPYDITFQE